jgi:3',5'-cyclic AMP phosphodiesterase CpdA
VTTPGNVPTTPDGLPAEVPDLVLAHLSDPHLTSAGVLYNGSIDPQAALDRVAATLRRATADGRGPDVIVVSGDLTDSGDPDAYRRLGATLDPLAPAVVYATGNHDVRTEFHAQLLHRPGEAGPVLQVHELAGVRIVVLDSTVVGAGHGWLAPDHLAELSGVLATAYPGGTVVVLHHAPIPLSTPLQTFFALDRRSRAALAGVLRGTDVRIVLAGHQHLAGFGMLAGIPVSVAASTAIRTDPLAPAGHERTFGSAGFSLVRLYADTVAVSVVPVDGAPEIFDLDRAGCDAVIAAHPVPQPVNAAGNSSTTQQPTSR